jgi:hypothetical protein
MISAALRGRRFMNSFLGPKMFVSNDSGRDKRDVRRAKKLAAAIVAKSRLTQRKPDIAKWSAEFRDLRLSGLKVTPVLKWYCLHVGEDGIPDVRSASGFRKRFKDIEKAMLRSDDAPKKKVPDWINKMVEEYFVDMDWPKGSIFKLPDALTESADNHWDLGLKLTELVEPWEDKPEREWPATVTLASEILADHNETHQFLLNWFAWVHRRVYAWPDWNGSFRQFVFRTDHKRWTAIMYDAAKHYTGDECTWNQLLEEITPQ